MLTAGLAFMAAAVGTSAALLAAGPTRAMTVPSSPAPAACAAPAELIGLAQVLPRVAQRIADGRPLKIVALGSSSTEGVGASSRANSYPSRLEAELRARFPGQEIIVVNLGIG